MAHYHFSAKLVKRRDGRKATQVAAYKLGQPIRCNHSKQTFDYSTTNRVVASGIEAPCGAPEWVQNHEELWNAVEARETRKDAQLLRDYELALPCELDTEAHIRLVQQFAKSIVDEFSVVVGWGVHMPRDFSDDRNIVAFLLLTTRAMEEGAFTRKIREMSVRPTSINIIADHRKRWADIQNYELSAAGLTERVDHRSLKDQRQEALAAGDTERAQKLDRQPTQKLDRKDYQSSQMRKHREQVQKEQR